MRLIKLRKSAGPISDVTLSLSLVQKLGLVTSTARTRSHSMRQSLIGLLCLFVLSGLGNSNAQETCSPVCPPSIAECQGESSEVIQRLLLRRASTVSLEVQLEQDVLDNSGTAERRNKMALKWLGGAMNRLSLRVVKNRKDADLLFVLVEGNSLQEIGHHTAIKEKLVVFPANPMDGDRGPLWESHWYKGEFGDPYPAVYAVTEFESLLKFLPPEAWIGAARPNDDGSPSVALTAKERRDLLLSAKTVAVLSFGRPSTENGGFLSTILFGSTPPFEFPDERKAYLAIETGLRTWNRFSIVKDPAKADLLFLIHVWNEEAEKHDRVQHQFLMSRLSIYRGQVQFGKAQRALWSGVEKAYTGSSTKKAFQRFRVEIDGLENGPALQ
jgi:hypothetical protein